ncbi:MAG: hypothetical protein KKB51_08145 [Candidatus Riflebacteria bacterium]|nr:hypothetical protein [Candidatus Riflebacteria bacterium]
MQIIEAIKGRRGSVAVLIGGIVLALLIFFGAFIKYSTSRQYATKRLNRVLLAREFSSALATLACHHLKDNEIHDLSGKLVKSLEKPLAAMTSKAGADIIFPLFINKLVDRLKIANSELQELTWQVSWEVRKEDFKPILAAYPREKIGMIRIPIIVKYLAPASLEKITEEYVYTVNIRIVANFIPVLSKFTLYVQDVRSGEDEERFNKVVNDDHGNLIESDYRPWILKNTEQNGPFPSRFADIIKSSRGLVYLGGGRVNLGIARAWSSEGKYAEGFHLLGEGRTEAFYKTGDIGPMALLNFETGLSKTDPNDSESVFWYDLIKSGFAELSAKSSIFKLYGTDNERSPTLVFGDAAARTLCARGYRESINNYGPLPYTYHDDQFADFISGQSEEYDFSYFMSQYTLYKGGTLSRSKYNKDYASCLIEVPYNRALGYIITNYKNNRPLDSGIIPTSDPLFDFVSGKAVSKGFAKKIPAPYSTVYSDVQDLSAMGDLLKKIEIPGRRAMAEIILAKGEKLLPALQKRGYLDKNKLDLNGWLHIKAEEGIVVDDSLLLISHGGIILAEGNIEVKSSIKADGGRFLLNLVARKGNIIVDSGLAGELDVGLTAAGEGSDTGQVKFAGNGSSSEITINGNVAMRRIAAGSLASYCSRGVKIVYDEDLAALPQHSADDRSEQPLLMFSFEYPRLLD